MNRSWTPLLTRLVIGAAAGAALGLLCTLFGLHLPLSLLISLGLLCGAFAWSIAVGADRAEGLLAPELDLDVDYALPHARDTQVRRLEDLAHGAQPRRRMTQRGLARVLGDIADERARDPEAPELSPALARLIETARRPDAGETSLGAIDRRTLHRCLTELAAREERDR